MTDRSGDTFAGFTGLALDTMKLIRDTWATERAKTVEAWLSVLMTRDGSTDPLDYELVEETDFKTVRWYLRRRPQVDSIKKLEPEEWGRDK